MDLESFFYPEGATRLTLCWRDGLRVGCTALGCEYAEDGFCNSYSVVPQRGITLPENRNHTLFRNACLRSFPSGIDVTIDWVLISIKTGGPALTKNLSPMRIGERKVMFFKLCVTELPKHRTCYPLIGWKEAGLGGLNVKH